MHKNNGGCKQTNSVLVLFAYSWVQQIRRNLGVSTCLCIVVRTLSPSASGPAIYGPNILSVIFVIYYTCTKYPLIYFTFKLHFERYQFVYRPKNIKRGSILRLNISKLFMLEMELVFKRLLAALRENGNG